MLDRKNNALPKVESIKIRKKSENSGKSGNQNTNTPKVQNTKKKNKCF